MDVSKVPPPTAVDQLQQVLDSPEVSELIRDLEAVRWTGRRGYPIRAMVGMCLIKSMLAIPTWSRTVRVVQEHELRHVLGCIPSQWACYRFASRLRGDDGRALGSCIGRVLDGLHERLPDMGRDVAVDGSDLPAFANGHRTTHDGTPREPSDPDASWGHRSAVSTRKGGGYFGYKLHGLIDTATDLPLAWRVESARESEQTFALPLIDTARSRGFYPRAVIADKGYDSELVHLQTMARGAVPVIPLKETKGVKRGDDKPPSCEHSTWTFCGADLKRRAAKWRCPSRECEPASTWVRANRLHPLVPRESKRYRELYGKRGAVEREFGRLKHEWSLLPLRIRGREQVQLHADLTVLTCLASRLAQERARAVPLAA